MLAHRSSSFQHDRPGSRVLDAYLGPGRLPFDRQLIVPGETGSIARAFAEEGIRVPPKAATPQIVVFDTDGRRWARCAAWADCAGRALASAAGVFG